MKRVLSLLVGILLVPCVHAGQNSLQREAETAIQPPAWYADYEFNVGLSGRYVFSATRYQRDRYLDADHAFGGGIDAKYFFARYFGLGIEGALLAVDRTSVDREGSLFLSIPPQFLGVESRTKELRSVGSVIGTFTLRCPIANSRFAPYAYLGGGAAFGGGERDLFRSRIDPHLPNEIQVSTEHVGSRTELVGKFGGGFEFRMTPHVGLINDFSWNVVQGSHNNFGMIRSGINFAF